MLGSCWGVCNRILSRRWAVRECPDRRPQAGHWLSIQGGPALPGCGDWCRHCAAFRETVFLWLRYEIQWPQPSIQKQHVHTSLSPWVVGNWGETGGGSFGDGGGTNCLQIQLTVITWKGSHSHSTNKKWVTDALLGTWDVTVSKTEKTKILWSLYLGLGWGAISISAVNS